MPWCWDPAHQEPGGLYSELDESKQVAPTRLLGKCTESHSVGNTGAGAKFPRMGLWINRITMYTSDIISVVYYIVFEK